MQFYFAYVREAHPVRTTKAPDPAKAGHGDIGRHETMASRAIAAGKCSSGLGMKMPILLDTMKNPAYTAYKGFPAGTHIIDLDGTIQYATRGPWGTTPKGAEVVLKKLLAALPKTPEEVFTRWNREVVLTISAALGESVGMVGGEMNNPPDGFTCRATGAKDDNKFSITVQVCKKKSAPAWAQKVGTTIRLPHSGEEYLSSISLSGAPKGLKEKLEALIVKYTHRLVVLDQQAAAKKKAEAKPVKPKENAKPAPAKPAVK